MRPGLIMGGECWIAPSELDVRTPSGGAFASMARNGIIVLCNGEQHVPVISYSEIRGEVVCALDGGTKLYTGKVRAIPGALG